MQIKTKTTFLKMVAALFGIEVEDIKLRTYKSQLTDWYGGSYVEYDINVNVNGKEYKNCSETLGEGYTDIYESMVHEVEMDQLHDKYMSDLGTVLNILRESDVDLSDNGIFDGLISKWESEQ